MEAYVNIERRGEKMTVNEGMVEFMRRRGWKVVSKAEENKPVEKKGSKKSESKKAEPETESGVDGDANLL